MINKYRDKISVIVSENDKGIYDAMNKGISLATGEWIHFRNSGDFFLRKDTLTKFFAEDIPADVSIIHGNCVYYDNDFFYEKLPPSLTSSYKKEIPVLHPATFIRTSLQKSMPFDLTYKSSADYDFFFKCSSKGVKYLYRPMTIVAFERGGFSSNWERAYFEDSKLQGRYKEPLGALKVRFTFWKKKFMVLRHNLVYGLPIFGKYIANRKASLSSNMQRLPFGTDF